MAHTDPIADMLTRIRNALKAGHPMVKVPASRLKIEIARIMREEGYIQDYKIIARDGNKRELLIELKYGPHRERVINGLRRISKPGLRIYAGKDEIPILLGGLGTVIVSTSRGVMTGERGEEAWHRRRGAVLHMVMEEDDHVADWTKACCNSAGSGGYR